MFGSYSVVVLMDIVKCFELLRGLPPIKSDKILIVNAVTDNPTHSKVVLGGLVPYKNNMLILLLTNNPTHGKVMLRGHVPCKNDISINITTDK